MVLRQYHEHDPINTAVTDNHGLRQGILLARYGQWCWVKWEEEDYPTAEHADDLWVCEKQPSIYDQIGAFVRAAWRPPVPAGI